jgi:hypothetical protein
MGNETIQEICRTHETGKKQDGMGKGMGRQDRNTMGITAEIGKPWIRYVFFHSSSPIWCLQIKTFGF